MKSIVLVALLAAGCSKANVPEGPNCAPPIGKGVDAMLAKFKARGAELPPQQLAMMTDMMGRLQTALVQRCTEDKWPAEALTCFETVSAQPEMRKCLDKLPPELHTKVSASLREVMMNGKGMRPVGHPQMGAPSAPGAPPAAGVAPSGSPAPAGAAEPAGSSAAPAAPAGSGSSAAGGW